MTIVTALILDQDIGTASKQRCCKVVITKATINIQLSFVFNDTMFQSAELETVPMVGFTHYSMPFF